LYINSILLITKYYIYSCKFKKVVPSFSGVISLLRYKYKIEFSELPIQYNFRETKLCFKEAIVLDNELEKLLKKGVVEVATHKAIFGH
jgi:hypothetical protein